MKLNRLAMTIGAMALCGSAAAELTANIGVTSNYVWRGVTQTDDKAAISGGVDYAHASGFYAGTWVSNVDFADDTGGQAELDGYLGFGGDLGGDLGYDIGAVYYSYPQAKKPGDELDFAEIYASLSFGPVSGGIAYTVYKESGEDENDLYYHLGASFEVASGWTLGGTVGYYDFDSGVDYKHAQLDLTKDVGDLGEFTLSLSKVFDDDDLELDDDLLVFVSWGKTFE